MTPTDCTFQEWKVDADSLALQTVETEEQNLSISRSVGGKLIEIF